jgi:tartrate dehydrogenase/decarboxylase/D-malate dehydrogenase
VEQHYEIALLPGDGIGAEVVAEAERVLDAAGARFGFSIGGKSYDWGCDRYRREGRLMPEDALERLAEHDAILLGAVGHPDVPDHVSLWGMLIPIRRQFDQYVNLRPVKSYAGVPAPLALRADRPIDYVIVRENTEGEYSEIGGRLFRGSEREVAVQEAVFTRHGVDRVLRYAFGLAEVRSGKHLTSATKSNGIIHTMPFWDERFAEVAKDWPHVVCDQFHIDILCAHLVQRPEDFDVIVASNLFGDILSDLGPATCGSIGLAPSGNINPERAYPSMFEPVHGSAPDIAGAGIANPVGQILSAAMMLDFLGQSAASVAIEAAVAETLDDSRLRTRDLEGSASTEEVGKAVAERL